MILNVVPTTEEITMCRQVDVERSRSEGRRLTFRRADNADVAAMADVIRLIHEASD